MGMGGAPPVGKEGASTGDSSSKELRELIEFDLRWFDFRGRLGGILGAKEFGTGGGGARVGSGGASEVGGVTRGMDGILGVVELDGAR